MIGADEVITGIVACGDPTAGITGGVDGFVICNEYACDPEDMQAEDEACKAVGAAIGSCIDK